MNHDPPPSYSEAIASEPHMPSAPPGDSGQPMHTSPYNPYVMQPQPFNNKQSNLHPAAVPMIAQPQPQQPPTTHVVVTHRVSSPNWCPACQTGVLQYDYTCLAIFCAIVFFPIGILCCLLMSKRRCRHCDAQF